MPIWRILHARFQVLRNARMLGKIAIPRATFLQSLLNRIVHLFPIIYVFIAIPIQHAVITAPKQLITEQPKVLSSCLADGFLRL